MRPHNLEKEFVKQLFISSMKFFYEITFKLEEEVDTRPFGRYISKLEKYICTKRRNGHHCIKIYKILK